MKCIKHVNNGEIKRVEDDEARKAVKSGEWQFIPKSEWKALRPKK